MSAEVKRRNESKTRCHLLTRYKATWQFLTRVDLDHRSLPMSDSSQEVDSGEAVVHAREVARPARAELVTEYIEMSPDRSGRDRERECDLNCG
jgi:hypothetical protein